MAEINKLTGRSHSRSYSVNAIVVRSIDFGESDRLVTLLTPYKGLIRAIARGARKPRSKLGGNVDFLRHISLSINRGRSIDSISQADVLSTFNSIRSDLTKTSAALYLSELTEKFSVEGPGNPDNYNLLLKALKILDIEKNNYNLPRWFEVQLLRMNGLMPEIKTCVDCSKHLLPNPQVFSAARGGLLCSTCRTSENDILIPASVGSIKMLRHMFNSNWTNVRQIKVPQKEKRQLARLLQDHIHYVTDRQIHSVSFMNEVAKKFG